MEGGAHRRLSLLEQMSAVDNGRNSLAGLTLDAVLSGGTTKPQRQEHQSNDNNNHHSRTLLDIIRDGEPPNSKDKKSWKNFREKLRLKRAGAAWTSSVPIPTSDISIPDNRSHLNRRGSVNRNEDSGPPPAMSRPQFTRRSSTRFGVILSDHDDQADIGMPGEGPPSRSFRPQISRHNSTRLLGSNEDDDSPSAGRRLVDVLTEERVMSARDAVAAQEAAEAEAAAAAAAAAATAATAAAAEQENQEDEVEPVRMSLMDLLEENDRELGLTGSRYTMGDDDDDDEYYDEDDDEEEEEEDGAVGIEYTCCVCMVRHKGAAFIPCGHTFCRLCSRELWVQRGNCPVCNGFILEILDIF